MPMISVSQAAKQFKVSRPTLQKALKDGTITGEKVSAGGSTSWQIDTAELARVYEMRKGGDNIAPRQDTVERQRLAMPKEADFSSPANPLQDEVATLREKLADAERRAAAEEAKAEERERLVELYKDQLSRAQDREAALMRLLPPPDAEPVQEQPNRKTLWQRIIGGQHRPRGTK
ncbi:hypothetical protein [Paracoccus sp. PARArs4]|uniref:hypothetical protein n=1 Tax=Paracoccus sp. PARArs4 TaxID=2853442 RepID=UPI0024A61F7A|nr:hypothetical protein [Paracoccus sp. PARArs4]